MSVLIVVSWIVIGAGIGGYTTSMQEFSTMTTCNQAKAFIVESQKDSAYKVKAECVWK